MPPLNLIFSQAMLNIVVYQILIVTNVPVNIKLLLNIINPCGYWTYKGTLFALVSNRNTLYRVMGVKTHLSVPVELR